MSRKDLTGQCLHTPLGLTGYLFKDEHEPHFAITLSHLYTAEMLQQARAHTKTARYERSQPVARLVRPDVACLSQARIEYLLHGNVTDKAVCYLTPKNYTAKVLTFKRTMNLYNVPNHRALLLMLRTRLFLPGNEWITGGTGPIDFARALAHGCDTRVCTSHGRRGVDKPHMSPMFAGVRRRLCDNALDATLDDMSLVFFGGNTPGMWTMEDVDATAGLLPVQMRASAARSAFNVAAGLRPDAIAGAAGPPLVAPRVTEQPALRT